MQWINFYRNVNIPGDGGAGSYVYHALFGATMHLPGWETLEAAGVIFRYYLSRAQLENPANGTNEAIEKFYQDKKSNPKILELVGTFAPLYSTEKLVAAPTGRLMTWNTPNIRTPSSNNNGPKDKNGDRSVALGPGVLHRDGDLLTADFAGTFPDNYSDADGTNPKFDFGPVTLVAVDDSQTIEVGAVNYADTPGGDAVGWLFDFVLCSKDDLKRMLDGPTTTFKLVSEKFGDVLAEQDSYFVSNQQAIYEEQHGQGKLFLNNGTVEPATVSVFHRGQELTATTCPPITVWQYRSVPMQNPGDAVPISTSFKPGDPLQVDSKEPGKPSLHVHDQRQRQPSARRVSTEELWLFHEPAICNERATDQLAYSSKRGLQPVLLESVLRRTGRQ